MNCFNEDKNNFFFANNCKNNLHKEKIILDQKSHRNSISTNETFENDFLSEDEEDIDFNQDFFPQTKKIIFSEMLIDNWKDKIDLFKENIRNRMIKSVIKED